MNRYPRIYEFSERWGPPKISLRDALILGDYGDDSYATRPIKHVKPSDVSRKDLDFYGWLYAFMGFHDLLFYLYPIALEYEKDIRLDCIDPFMYSLDIWLPSEIGKLRDADQEALLAGLQWIWFAGDSGYADWSQCPALQRAIGVYATHEDQKMG